MRPFITSWRQFISRSPFAQAPDAAHPFVLHAQRPRTPLGVSAPSARPLSLLLVLAHNSEFPLPAMGLHRRQRRTEIIRTRTVSGAAQRCHDGLDPQPMDRLTERLIFP
jgi:hypothetical protein